MQKMYNGEIISKETLNILCELLNHKPDDIMEYVPDQEPEGGI